MAYFSHGFLVYDIIIYKLTYKWGIIMAISNNKTLYFDRVARTKKLQTVNALAHATYYSNGNKEETINCLGDYLDKIRDGGKGSYGEEGKDKKEQFDGQYTPGREFGVWTETRDELVLTDLAKKMVEGKITPEYYISNVMRNYYQIINNKVVNPLYSVLNFMDKTAKSNLYKEDIKNIKDFNLDSTERDNTGVLFNILGDTVFFNRSNEKDKLVWSNIFSIKDVINMCDITLLQENVDDVKRKYSNQHIYANFITKE